MASVGDHSEAAGKEAGQAARSAGEGAGVLQGGCSGPPDRERGESAESAESVVFGERRYSASVRCFCQASPSSSETPGACAPVKPKSEIGGTWGNLGEFGGTSEAQHKWQFRRGCIAPEGLCKLLQTSSGCESRLRHAGQATLGWDCSQSAKQDLEAAEEKTKDGQRGLWELS